MTVTILPSAPQPDPMSHNTRIHRSAPSSRTGHVTSTRPDPLAWEAALNLEGGDARRLVVMSPTEILVNHEARGR
jgi:hypothetical protein